MQTVRSTLTPSNHPNKYQNKTLEAAKRLYCLVPIAPKAKIGIISQMNQAPLKIAGKTLTPATIKQTQNDLLLARSTSTTFSNFGQKIDRNMPSSRGE
ncbi:MAG: hypothetical protein NW208_01870 [Bryobacter sp.]|nr:hypothetical protein [Bryobacter sp.]